MPVKWTETELKTTRMRLRGVDIAAKGMETGLKESETEVKGLSTERKNVRPHPNSLSQERGEARDGGEERSAKHAKEREREFQWLAAEIECSVRMDGLQANRALVCFASFAG